MRGRATLGVEKGVMALLGVRAASVPVSRALPWSLVCFSKCPISLTCSNPWGTKCPDFPVLIVRFCLDDASVTF